MITIEKVKHIAALARLDISEQQAEKMAGEMGAILNYIDELNSVNTDNVEPTAQITGLTNVTRADVAVNWPADERKMALEQAELTKVNLVKVPKIL